MSTHNFEQSPEIQAYLDLTNDIETSLVGSGLGSSLLFTTANFHLTTILSMNFIPQSFRLGTFQSYAAYYAIAFAGEFISEMLERNGDAQTASYFGTEYANLPDMDFGNNWYDNIAESFIDASLDTLMGISTTIDLLTDIAQLDFSGIRQMVQDAFNSSPAPIAYDDKYKNGSLWIVGNTYTYTYEGGSGNDYFDMDELKKQGYLLEPYGTFDDVIVKGGRGKDYIANVTKAYGERGDDQIINAEYAWGGRGKDYIANTEYDANGGDGDDYITNTKGAADGEGGKDFIKNTRQRAYGGDDDDILINNNVSRGQDGDDYIVGSSTQYNGLTSGISDHNILDGGAGDDYLEGKGTNEELLGGTGADILIGGGGNDTIDGGEEANLSGSTEDEAATDVAVFRRNANFTITQLTGSWEYQVTGQGTDKFKNIESVIVQAGRGNNTIDATALALPSTLDGLEGNDTIHGGSNSDIIVGGLGNDMLYGNDQADILMGEAGDDTLVGGNGSDILDGGSGVDTVDYSDASNGVTVNLLTGNTTEDGFGHTDTLANLENVVGTQSKDFLTGDHNANHLIGNRHHDRLDGQQGNDTLDGGEGNDTLYGREGDDWIDGGVLK